MDKVFDIKIDDRVKKQLDSVDVRLSHFPLYTRLKGKYARIFTLLVIFIAAIYAAHLSWKCSGYKDGMLINRVISAVLAAMLNLIYVLYYYLTKTDTCYIMKRLSEVNIVNKRK